MNEGHQACSSDYPRLDGVYARRRGLIEISSQRHAHLRWSADLQPQLFATRLYVAAQGGDRW